MGHVYVSSRFSLEHSTSLGDVPIKVPAQRKDVVALFVRQANSPVRANVSIHNPTPNTAALVMSPVSPMRPAFMVNAKTPVYPTLSPVTDSVSTSKQPANIVVVAEMNVSRDTYAEKVGASRHVPLDKVSAEANV
tara:strand:+ start:10808 stop:11212 length:405 start_codon:yes stop_codon:yes gene_type:complete